MSSAKVIFALVVLFRFSIPVTSQRSIWTQWSFWSSCLTICGPGYQLRSRACSSNLGRTVMETSCIGGRLQKRRCSGLPCNGLSETPEPPPVANNPEGDVTAWKEPVCPWQFNSGTTSCGVRPPVNPIKKILGGVHARANSWPWQVALWSRSGLVCSATVIHRAWLITAAHCFYNLTTQMFNLEAFEVRFGLHNRNDNNATIVVIGPDNVIIHPNFDIRRKTNDIALIRLNEPLTFDHVVAPVCLPDYSRLSVQPGNSCYVLGWGETKGFGPSNDRLKELSVVVVPNDVCRYTYRYAATYMIVCAGGEVNQDTCKGDSGGPLLCQSSVTGKWEIQGIVSFGSSRCGQLTYPTLFMQVSYFLPWIQRTTQYQCFNWRRSLSVS